MTVKKNEKPFPPCRSAHKNFPLAFEKKAREADVGAKDKAGDGLKGSQAMDKAMDEHKGAGIGAEPKKGDIGSGQKKKKRLLDGVKMR